MIKAKNILLMTVWIAVPTAIYFAQATALFITTDWPQWGIKIKDILLYGIWPVLPLIFVSKPKFQFVKETGKKWRNEVPIKNNYRGFGVFGVVALMVLCLALYFLSSDTFVVPNEILISLLLTLGILIYSSQNHNHVIQQFFSFSSDLDYDYRDLQLQMRKMEKDSHTAPQEFTVADNHTTQP